MHRRRRGVSVLAPDQRGYGRTDKPAAIETYDIVTLTGDLVGLLIRTYGRRYSLVTLGRDRRGRWHSASGRVAGVNQSGVPFMDRGTTGGGILGKTRWRLLHRRFNRQPGVADAAFARSPKICCATCINGGWEIAAAPLKPAWR
jgi:hypothetical protein